MIVCLAPMKLLVIAVAASLAHGLNMSVPMMSAIELKAAQAKWGANMEASPPDASTLTCTTDFRSQLPSCIQYEPEWCWATAVSEMWGFFNSEVRSHMSRGDCHGFECKIAGHVLYRDAPQKCCESSLKEHCGQRAGSLTDITGAIAWATGKTYGYRKSSLSQSELDSTLSMGYPVAIGVYWNTGGGHMLTLGGCAGGGKYYLHDPAEGDGGQSNHYQTLTYQQILKYVPPSASGAGDVYGSWLATFVYSSGEATAEDSGVVVV